MIRQGIRFNERNHSYTIDGQRVVSVTTALKGIPKDALVPWAARLVAEYVADNLDDVRRMMNTGGRAAAVSFLKELPNAKRDTAAVRGTAVHKLAEQVIRGDEVDVPEDLVPYVEGYLRFIDDYQPVSIAEELMVGSREHRYAGRLDSIQDLPGLGRALVDYKTSRNVYGETALQVAAYRYADMCMDGDQEAKLGPVDLTYVLHIQPGTYDLRPLAADRAAFAKFLKAKDNYLENVQSRRLDKLIGEPIEPPEREVA